MPRFETQARTVSSHMVHAPAPPEENVRLRIIESQLRILREFADNRSHEALQRVCLLLEEQIKGARSCVMLTQPTSGRLRVVTAPSLSRNFKSRLDGLAITGNDLCLTRSARTGQVEFERDVQEDHGWQEYHELTTVEGMRSCWVTPLRAEVQETPMPPYGVLAFFFDHVLDADPGAVALLEMAGELMSIALQLARRGADYGPRATTDVLTGLSDRGFFQDRVKQAIEESEQAGSRFAVMMLDIDQLKHVNNTVGFGVGDRLLQAVAHRLTHCVRTNDVVARAGSDEFLLLFKDIQSDEDLPQITSKIEKTVHAPYDFQGQPLFVNTSVGISLYPKDGQDSQTLIKKAEVALMCAKEDGRRDLQVFHPRMFLKQPTFQTWSEQLKLGSDLRSVIERQQLEVVYQLKMRRVGHQPCGVEALLRWRHPTMGVLQPPSFLHLAEQTGLILPLGQWVLEKACSQLKEWQNLVPPGFSLSVNVSGQQFRHGNLVTTVKKVLEETKLEPKLLELEITENLAMQDIQKSSTVVQQLKSLGVNISIDDFGTGFSSLSYLTWLPISTLKIDRSFVHLIGVSQNGEAIVRSVISLAKDLKLQVVAEGVETQEQLDFLSVYRCDAFQGFYFSRPISAPELTKVLQDQIQVWWKDEARL
jgi:diguanylate cyclase (GGDEF)-like protein